MGQQQTSIFEFMYENYSIEKPIRLIELFSGIGAQSKALENLGADFENWRTCDWAVPSIHAYTAIHKFHLLPCLSREEFAKANERLKGVSLNYNTPISPSALVKKPQEWKDEIAQSIAYSRNLVNIMNVHAEDLDITDTEHYTYVMTYSFPCQDLSLAGNKKGMSVSQSAGGTRSGLLWEVERILDELREREREVSLKC